MFSQEWTKHLKTDEEKASFYNEVMGSKRVLDRLKDMISAKEQSLDYQEMSLGSYESPNWGYRQAHNNGFRQCLTAYKNLLNLDQQDNNNDPKQSIRAG